MHYKKFFNRPFGPIIKTVEITLQTIDESNMENNKSSISHQLKNCWCNWTTLVDINRQIFSTTGVAVYDTPLSVSQTIKNVVTIVFATLTYILVF